LGSERQERLAYRRRFKINPQIHVAHVVKRRVLNDWAAKEDATVWKLRQSRIDNDPEEHARLRARLEPRSDDEVAERSRWLWECSARGAGEAGARMPAI
jgi:hypothetical protein